MFQVMEPRDKEKGSIIRQMLTKYYKNELEEEVLAKDFTLGVNLGERNRYHRIVEKDGEYICIRHSE